MSSEKNKQKKARLHSRNKNRERYDLSALTTSNPELKNHIIPNKFGEDSVDFSNPLAVKLLNKALLNHYYGIKNWEFPDENLCPPIPGRADYIHHMADLLAENNFGTIPTGDIITCLDIGLGASCIYPIIGVTEYGWKFIGSDIDPKSIASAQNIVNSNSSIKDKIECRLQKNSKDVFHGIIGKEDIIELIICNPPFHSSIEDAQKGTRRKIKNLSGKKVKTPELNFAGISNELICDGGEYKFIQNMIIESEKFSKNCFWFSTLVSKQSNLTRIYNLLEKTEANQIKTIPMGTGNKSSRIVAWTFLSKEERKEWSETRWKTLL
ncbi:23S rRNA (adenine(1618)-N(6))-methyltransferase RlmF [uncultured Eudoraea sp.]|uniref:23S rRNA (adenine(1618)-N(6))-methyltransferase RlmF n=1 Tax=uncultured Eudoraea sp. TaxID=1035614 RepID=UPI00262E7BF1|nr:23S rRNA (adenine(1618)-N(6))-methyltransferase RlmF [uncultured Eudoraea sp.]